MSRLVFLLLLCFIGMTTAAVTKFQGDCPGDVMPGQIWYSQVPECMKCECGAGEYTCFSCTPAYIPLYCIAIYNTTAHYPECCDPLVACE